ncbi:hypothetical protein EV714DRAFT_241631 [Schizophyllum commune]
MLSEDIEAIGVLKLNVQSAQIVKSSFRQGLSPEIYVKVSRFLGDEIARTKFSNDSTNPHWMETLTILVRSFTDRLHLGVYDYHRHVKHKFLGGTALDLAPLEHEHALLAINRPLVKDTKPTGEILLDASFHPLAPIDSHEPYTWSGVARLLIIQARDLSGGGLSEPINASVQILLNQEGKPVYQTRPFVQSDAPVWLASHELYCADRERMSITARIVSGDHNLGQVTIRLDDLLEGKENGVEWWPLTGATSGQLKMSAVWRPLRIEA